MDNILEKQLKIPWIRWYLHYFNPDLDADNDDLRCFEIKPGYYVQKGQEFEHHSKPGLDAVFWTHPSENPPENLVILRRRSMFGKQIKKIQKGETLVLPDVMLYISDSPILSPRDLAIARAKYLIYFPYYHTPTQEEFYIAKWFCKKMLKQYPNDQEFLGIIEHVERYEDSDILFH